MLSRTGKGFLIVAGGALALLQVKLSFSYQDNLKDFLGEQKGAKDFQKGQEAFVKGGVKGEPIAVKKQDTTTK